VKLLLDTHALLWFLAGSGRLSATARAAIENEDNQRLFSIAGAWELAIKITLGKLALTFPFDTLASVHLPANGIDLLQLEFAHTVELTKLPLHHRDPFDRILVAQAKTEGATLVSADPVLDAYGAPRLW
jgi:PIN domain nuclease of toxin-antitoxin system